MHTECSASCAAQPVDIGYLPGSPGHIDLASAHDLAQPVWFDLNVLATAYELQHHDGFKPSVMKLSNVLRRLHADGDCSDVCCGADTLRQLLGGAVRQYAYLRCYVEDPANLGVEGWPNSGPVAQCGGCWKAAEGVSLQDVHFDCCFKLNHLQREGAGWRWLPAL